MAGPLLLLVVLIIMPVFLIFYTKKRVVGKVHAVILKRDKTWESALCDRVGPEGEQFVIWKHWAFRLVTQFVRLTRFPSGLPSILQESVPSVLLDEELGVNLDWETLQPPTSEQLRSANIRSALEEVWIRRTVHEAATAGASLPNKKFNWKKALPMILIIGGVIGFIVITQMNGGLKLPGLGG